MASLGRAWWTFPTAAVACGLVFWWFADWRAYIGNIPKFSMPGWWQVMVSGVVGAVGGSCFVGLRRLTVWTWSRRRPA